eukprot:UN3387
MRKRIARPGSRGNVKEPKTRCRCTTARTQASKQASKHASMHARLRGDRLVPHRVPEATRSRSVLLAGQGRHEVEHLRGRWQQDRLAGQGVLKAGDLDDLAVDGLARHQDHKAEQLQAAVGRPDLAEGRVAVPLVVDEEAEGPDNHGPRRVEHHPVL